MIDPIRARCRACRHDFSLVEVAGYGDGRCPRCGRPLAPTYATILVREATRACRAHRDLLESVRVLVGLPGNLELIPHSVVRHLLEEVDWAEEIAEDRDLIRREIEELERMARPLAGEDGHREEVELRKGLKRLTLLLAGHADRLEARHRRAEEALCDEAVLPPTSPEAVPVRAAAAHLEALAADPDTKDEAGRSQALDQAKASIESHTVTDEPGTRDQASRRSDGDEEQQAEVVTQD